MRFSSLDKARSLSNCSLYRHTRPLPCRRPRVRRFASLTPSLRAQDSKKTDWQATGIRHLERFYDPEKKEYGLRDQPDTTRELARLKTRIKEIEAEIKNDEELGILAAFEGEDREKATQILKENETKHKARRAGQQIATLNIPVLRRQRPYLDKLNKYLSEAQSSDITANTRKELWRWYTRSKQHLPPFLYLIPPPVWNVLWTTLNQSSSSNLEKWAHLKIVSEDIIAAGHELSSAQKIAYIEALHFEGQPEKAVEYWGNEIVAVGMDMKAFPEFWALGVRIFAAQGDPDRAQKTANMLLGSRGGTDIRVLLPVIKAWIEKGGATGFRNAWNLYMQVKERLGPDIKIEDYDTVSMSFLKAGQKDLALAVFKDMMLTGDPNGVDSLALYKKAMGLIGGIQSITVDANEAMNISLEAMTVLPRQFQNKFFYGSWIKKLIGMSEVDAAASVVELMCDRGVRPAPRHINGIIGAWFRLGSGISQQKAEALALAMIERRRIFVQGRTELQGQTYESKETGKSVQRTGQIHDRLPPATLETFCVLASYYSHNNMYKELKRLRQSVYDCNLTPNADFMNQCLYSSLRDGGLGEVWRQYNAMTTRNDRPVRANIYSFDCLWDCMAMKRGRISKASSDGDFPADGKALFGEMQRWWVTLKASEHAQESNQMPSELYDNILRCFGLGLQPDVAGMVVAMFSMRENQGVYPGDSAARTILLNLVESREDQSPRGPRKLQKLSRVEKTNKKELTEALKHVQDSRMEYLDSINVNIDSFDEKALGEEKLVVLTDFLMAILKQSLEDSESVLEHLKQVAWEMDVPFVGMKDHLDSTH